MPKRSQQSLKDRQKDRDTHTHIEILDIETKRHIISTLQNLAIQNTLHLMAL